MPGTVIIGGGAIGLSVAYHLAKLGADDVVLLERNQLTSGTSWHAAGIVGPLRATPNMTRLAMYAGVLFPELETETGMSTGYKVTGGYWLARRKERMDELNRIASLGRHFGLTPEILDLQESRTSLPYLNLAIHAGAMAVAEDASVNPVDLCMAYARAAKDRGVDIREGTEVVGIVKCGNKVSGVRLKDGSVLHAENVVICAGAWSKPLAESAGLALPLQAVEHMYVVTEPIAGLPDPFPVLRDLDTGIYIKGDAGGKLIIGGFEPDAKCWNAFGPEGDRAFLELPEDWEQFAPFMEAALELLPALETAGIQRFMNGPESFTNDTKPLVGEAPGIDGLFVAAGMNSVGVMSSAGIGRALAKWIASGFPHMDLWEVDIARTDPATADGSHMAERMKEAVSDQFTMHWPYKQPQAGRGLRKSPLHEKWAKQGAVFGLTAGWERGLWYARSDDEKSLPYAVGNQPWQHIIERESREMEEGAVLLDLSPFTKIDISGPDALAFLEKVTCSTMDRAAGSVIYTAILNERGGIEADLTITRISADQFRITSGAATRWRDLSLLRKRVGSFEVLLEDVTEREVVIAVMGARARKLLSSVSKDKWDTFKFSTSRSVSIAGFDCRATRVSFVGELGWELSTSAEAGAHIFDALQYAGAKPMGHYALDGCRVEKGFYHWGHDLGPEITPLEAGLAWLVNWEKDFIGRDALETQKQSGIKKRLCLFEVVGNPLLLHDEPIWENDKVVGLTTSGTKGPRTGLTLAFGLIEVCEGESKTRTCERAFQIEIAGEFYPATALPRIPYDPSGERMRT